MRSISYLQNVLGCDAGLAAHIMGVGVAVASVAVGAVLIEKHFTSRRRRSGFGILFGTCGIKSLVVQTERAWQSLGEVKCGVGETEVSSAKHRRSVVVSKDVKRGDLLSPENIKVVRPASGMHPRYFELLIGTKASRDLAAGTRLTWDVLLT